MWTEKELSSLSVVGHFLQPRALISLILLYSYDHWPFPDVDLINEHFKVILTDSLFRLTGSFNQGKEGKDKFFK